MSRIIFFDIDNTLTEDNSWERLNIAAGITVEEDNALYKKFSAGEISYQEWTKQLEYLYNSRQILNHEIAQKALINFTIRPDAKSTIKQLQALGYEVVLLTGGFKATAKKLAEEMEIQNFIYVTDLLFRDEHAIHLESKGEEGIAKLRLANEYCDIQNVSIKSQWAVGDSSNDIPLFKVVERSFTFTWSKDNVKDAATDQIDELGDILKKI